MKGSLSGWRRKDQMTTESQNKLLARRFMEEVVNAEGSPFGVPGAGVMRHPLLGQALGKSCRFFRVDLRAAWPTSALY